MQVHPGSPSRGQARRWREQSDRRQPPQEFSPHKTTGNLDKNDEELDNEDIEDDESLKDKGKTAPMLHARTPPHPQVSMALFGLTEVFGSTTGGKTQGKTGQSGSAANFYWEQLRGGISRGKPDRA